MRTRPLRIAVVAHMRFAIAPPFRGGMEAHCAQLCTGLVAAGHDVTLFAAAGSASDARLHAIADAPYEDVLPWHDWHGTPELAAWQDAAFARAWRAIGAGAFDIVHNNSLYPGLIAWAARDGVPMLTSQHVPPFGPMRDAVTAAAGDPLRQFSVTSRDQARLWAEPLPPNMTVVHNGIDTARWKPTGVRTTPLLWSGRITPTKGTAEALAAAHLAGVPLDIVGGIEDGRYFAERVAPLLDERRRHLGHLSGDALRDRVAAASALVASPMWAEPFGLVVAEALACDVPVIAFDAGAMREVVGDAGVIVPAGDVAALAQAMREPPRLPAGFARDRALAAFSLPTMISAYERLYARAMAARVPVGAAA